MLLGNRPYGASEEWGMPVTAVISREILDPWELSGRYVTVKYGRLTVTGVLVSADRVKSFVYVEQGEPRIISRDSRSVLFTELRGEKYAGSDKMSEILELTERRGVRR